MTRDEVKKIVAIIKYTYPKSIKDEEVSMVVDAWAFILADEDSKAIGEAVKKYCASGNAFAPNPGQLIQMAKPPEKSLSEMEAWSMVRKAIANGIYGAEKEYSKLPPTVQKAVGDPGQLRAWAMMEIDSLQTVAQSNFMRVYRAETKKADDNALRLEVQEQLRIGVEE